MAKQEKYIPLQLFDTEDDQLSAVAKFKELLKMPGWKLVEDIFNAEVESLKVQILAGITADTAEAAKKEEDRLRLKLQIIEDILYTPAHYIEEFNATDDSEDDDDLDDDDVYDTPESIAKRREKSTG